MSPPHQCTPTKSLFCKSWHFVAGSENSENEAVPQSLLQLLFFRPCCGTSGPFPVGVLPPGPPESLLEESLGTGPPACSLLWVQAELGPTPRAWPWDGLGGHLRIVGPSSPGLGMPVGLGFSLSHLRKESPNGGSEEEQ